MTRKNGYDEGDKRRRRRRRRIPALAKSKVGSSRGTAGLEGTTT
jgi:hypothetical protein